MSDLREKVARAIADVREGGWPADTYAMLQQHYLTMADAAIAVIGPVRVKPLDWEDQGQGSYTWPLGLHYYVEVDHHGHGVTWYAACMIGNDDVWSEVGFPTLEAAKAAAQADYESRILSAIEAPQP